MFVKICGTTSEADALLAVAMGADAVGFIFAAGSKRQIAPQRAGDIAKRLPPEVLTVGVFRDHSPKKVVEIVNRQGLGAAQLHGRESIEETAWITERVARTMKVFVAGSENARRARDWGTNPIMLDNAEAGSGRSYDYSLARETPSGLSVLLAGGLHPGNVADAILTARPWGVDVASGVEKAQVSRILNWLPSSSRPPRMWCSPTARIRQRALTIGKPTPRSKGLATRAAVRPQHPSAKGLFG